MFLKIFQGPIYLYLQPIFKASLGNLHGIRTYDLSAVTRFVYYSLTTQPQVQLLCDTQQVDLKYVKQVLKSTSAGFVIYYHRVL